MVIRKHRDKAEDMIGFLQDDSWKQITGAKLRPSDHPVWGGPGWKVFLNSQQDIERTVRHVRNNPIKAARPEQSWDFITEYDGWLPGVGKTR